MNSTKLKILLLTLLAVSMLPALHCLADLSPEDTYAEFNKANDAFRAANLALTKPDSADRAKPLYTQAILHYEKITNDAGIKNAKLYYNLANAYMLKGDIGRAILNYKRAEKLEPADSNIQKNLAFARSRRMDKVQIKTQKRVLQTLFFWHYDFSLKTRLVVACAFFGILCIVLTMMILTAKRMPFSFVSIAAAVLSICFAASVAIADLQQRSHAQGVVLAASAVARQGDGRNYPPQYKEPLHTGTEFELIEQRPAWLHIRLADGSDSWIEDSTAELL